MVILGYYGDVNNLFNENHHDASFSLIKDGIYLGSFTQERFSRKKYDYQFSFVILNDILKKFNLSLKDINVVAYPNNYEFILSDGILESSSFKNLLQKTFFNSEIRLVDHHIAHSMCAVLTSNFNNSNFFSLDGIGSLRNYNSIYDSVGNYGMFGTAEKNPFKMYKLSELNVLKSDQGAYFTIGNFYSFFSRVIYDKLKIKYNFKEGDKVFQDHLTLAGKIMGLSAYGKKVERSEKKIISVERHYSYDMPQIYFQENFLNYYQNYLFDLEPEDLAWWLQNTFEEVILKYLFLVPSFLKEKNLCLAGGCSLNVLLNSKIISEKIYSNIHVHPATSDVGLSLGAALITATELDINVSLPENLGCVGLDYDQDYIKSIKVQKDSELLNFYSLLDNLNLNFSRLSYDEIYEKVSEELKDNRIVAWFQGKSEYGPRALGNRSILANPCFDNKTTLNNKIKMREFWRPYAAAVMEEYQNDWFEIQKQDSYYMLFSSIVKKEKLKYIPAVTHVDNTCRIQTVNSKQNLHLYNLIKSFYDKTSIPLLLNTSFNTIKNEPIVETPVDAVKSFINSKIDILIINDILIMRKNNETHNGEIIPLQTN